MAQEVNPVELQKALEGMEYGSEGASKEELLQKARDNNAPEEVMTFLERIDEGNYENPADVQKELGRLNDE